MDYLAVPKDYSTPLELNFVLNHCAGVFSEIEDLLVNFVDNEARIRKLLTAPESFSDGFTRWVKSQRSGKYSGDSLDFETAIRLHGATEAMDLWLSFKFKEALWKKPVGFDEKTGLPDILPQAQIPFALKTREHYGVDSRYGFYVFLAGLTYDLIWNLNQKMGEDKVRTEKLIQSQYYQAISVAQSGLKKGKESVGLALEKYMIATILMKRVGRLIFPILRPNYIDFANRLQKLGVRSRFSHIAEIKTWKVSNNVISCLLCKFVPHLNRISLALLYYDYPYMLNDNLTKSELYELVRHCSDLLPDPES